jgi:hypothetical protein
MGGLWSTIKHWSTVVVGKTGYRSLQDAVDNALKAACDPLDKMAELSAKLAEIQQQNQA